MDLIMSQRKSEIQNCYTWKEVGLLGRVFYHLVKGLSGGKGIDLGKFAGRGKKWARYSERGGGDEVSSSKEKGGQRKLRGYKPAESLSKVSSLKGEKKKFLGRLPKEGLN